MTIKEKVSLERPEKADPFFAGGMVGCPNTYGVNYRNPECDDLSIPMEIKCQECWNAPLPEEDAAMMVKRNVLYGDGVPVMAEPENDPVEHPVHYTKNGIECIDAIAAVVSDMGGVEGWLTGQVLKYVWRWKLKNGVEDLKKAEFYLKRLITHIENDSKEEKGND